MGDPNSVQNRKSDTLGKKGILFITISKTSGVVEGLNGLVVGVSGPKIKQEYSSA